MVRMDMCAVWPDDKERVVVDWPSVDAASFRIDGRKTDQDVAAESLRFTGGACQRMELQNGEGKGPTTSPPPLGSPVEAAQRNVGPSPASANSSTSSFDWKQ